MTAELRTFAFEGQSLRIVLREEVPWWIASEVGEILGLKGDGGIITRGLDQDEKGLLTVQTPGGGQRIMAVSESGLYALIFKSRKPEAKRFRKWVTAEVLPALRRTGRYEVPTLEASTWTTTGKAARLLGIPQSTLKQRMIAQNLPNRLREGYREVPFEVIRAHFLEHPVQARGQAPRALKALRSRSHNPAGAMPAKPLPDGATLQAILSIYGPVNSRVVLHRLNPRVFPEPTAAKRTGGAR